MHGHQEFTAPMKIKPKGKAIGRLYLLKIPVANSQTGSELATDETKLLYHNKLLYHVLLCSCVLGMQLLVIIICNM